MSDSIKFTVIVPTRERSDTLVYCLRTLITQDYDNAVFIVSDNFSQDNTKEVVESFKDPRILYINTGKRISMSHNWEYALSHVSSGWVMFIGDDDGLLPGALSTLNTVILESKCQALTTMSCTFFWPGHFTSYPKGELTVPLVTDKLYLLKNSQNMLLKVMNGRAGYPELPWLYNGGAASMDLINKIRAQDGSFFRSMIPDVYSAVALSLSIESYAFVQVPVAINGASKHSGGTSSMLGQDNNKSSPAHKFWSEDNIPAHKSLVIGKSIPLMIYECYLQAQHLSKSSISNLKSQLEIALAVSPKAYRQEIESDCLYISKLNNISMPSPLRVSIKRLSYLISVLLGRVFKTQSITIAPADINAMDVYAASKAAAHIYGVFDSIARQSFFSKKVMSGFLFLIGLSRYFHRIFRR
ncbi:MAG: glycosyltransferase family A protein [Methylococcaceae bacterium]